MLYKDRDYCIWLLNKDHLINPEIKEYLTNSLTEDELTKEYTMTFGKHRGKRLSWVYDNDIDYFNWLKLSSYVIQNMKTLSEEIAKIES